MAAPRLALDHVALPVRDAAATREVERWIAAQARSAQSRGGHKTSAR